MGLQGLSGAVVDITGQIQGGSLGALITTRDATIPGYLSNLNGLAKSITQNVNYFSQKGNGGTPDQAVAPAVLSDCRRRELRADTWPCPARSSMLRAKFRPIT